MVQIMMPRNIIVIAFLVAALMSVGESGLIPRSKLVYIGMYSKPSSETVQATSYYFRSQNAAGWATSGNDCKANLGDTASLVSMETQEELVEVSRFIESSDDTGSSYWTGGKFDSDKRGFAWETGVEINSTAPWDQGHPITRTPVTRVLIYTFGGGLKLRTDFQTVSLRYICELIL